MKHFIGAIAGLLVLVACGSLPASGGPSAQGVINAFTSAGLNIANVKRVEHPDDATWPDTYREHLTFVLPDHGNKGGHVMVCDSKTDCDAVYTYFDSERELTGPYLYQSPNGRVIVQLNGGIVTTEAARYEAIVDVLP